MNCLYDNQLTPTIGNKPLMTTMSTMTLAWSNAKCASKWHGKGKPVEYFAGSLTLAHKGINLKRNLMVALAGMSVVSLAGGIGLGYFVASQLTFTL